jgi:hypothetical protein
MADLREFRKSVSVLKKQGLLPNKIGRKKLDARKALPDMKVKGKKLSTLVRKYDDVVSGKLTAVKVPPASLRQYRKAGFETASNRVLVPHTKTETAKFTKKNIIVVPIKNKFGVERIQIPVEFRNLKKYLTDIRRESTLIDSMKRKNEYFGIRFYGGQRANFYSTIDLLLEDLIRYESIETATNMVRAKQQEIYKNLEIVRITQRGAKNIEHHLKERKRRMSKAYNRRHAKRVYEARKAKGPAVMNAYRRKQAEASKAYRARLKGTKKTAYKRKAKKRAAKSYTKHRKKRK